MTRAMPNASMDDWLTLHGLSPISCAALLTEDAPDVGGVAAATLELDAAAAWSEIGAAISRAAPDLAPLVQRTRSRARTILDPDPARYPRALTLRDDGTGAPVVLCPRGGTVGDLLILAHELGHAMNYLASGRIDPPPVLRETCAILCETLALRGLPAALASQAAPVAARRRARHLGALGGKLRAALDNPAAVYDYDWNYAPARRLADMVADARGARLGALFASELTVAELAAQATDGS